MKLFVLVLGFLMSVMALASTRDYKTVTFSRADSATVDLKADKTHTEYRTVTEPRTCFRRMIVGYQTRCNPQGQCTQIPIWQNVPYTCYVTVSVPYEVFDYTVDAKVTLNLPEYADTRALAVKVELVGDQLSYTATGLNDMIVERKELSFNRTQVGPKLVNLENNSDVALTPAAPYQAALKMANGSVKKSVLTYKLGATEGLRIQHKLKLSKDPIIGSSTILYNDALKPEVMSSEVQGAQTQFQVAFKDLIGRVLGNGRYSVDFSADFDGEVLNDKELGGLKTSKSILYKISK